jgi:class 3 adenylate cyclase/tetratricopeptide (TPR) repeat protein
MRAAVGRTTVTTENVAILFTDIVGSTELSQRLSQAAADEVRRRHFSVLRQAITEAGGTEVKNLGDGIMVVFRAASAALGCAVAMQQGVEQANRGNGEGVGLRAGLSAGEVSGEDGDYFGDPVVEASRLCAECQGGQILASDVVLAIAGRRNQHECRPLGELALKGLPDPVETVEVLWEPLGEAETAASVPLPGRLALRPTVGVVGRETEMAAISDVAKRVTGGGVREILLVSGEAGLGKTTLVAEAARSAFNNGACVLFGHCEENLASPYQLFAEALGHYVTHAPEEQLIAHVEIHGSELSRLVPALAGRIPDLPPSKATDSDTERFLLFAAVVGLLAAVAEREPVTIVFDDLQWADKGSLLLLRHLAAADHSMRILILATYRDSELSQSGSLADTLAALHRQSGISHLEMGGLDDSGVVAFLEAAGGQILDPTGVGLAQAIYRETDGNPFFVSEVLRHLSETQAIYQDEAGRWVADLSLEQMALPDSVRMVIGARVGRLGQEAGRVLTVASVIGRDFDLDLLARAAKTSDDDLLDILDAASAAALVRELADRGRYSFAHALIQHTVYEAIGHNRQAQIHRQVAEALEELCGDRPGARVGELARHWVAATQPIDLAKTIDYSRQAGDSALAGLAPADALRYYAQALDLYPQITDPDPVLGIDLAIGLGTAQRQTGDPAFRDSLLSAARSALDVGDTHRLVAAALANNRGFFSAGGNIDLDRVQILESALGLLSDDDPDRALVLSTLCAELCYGSPLARRQALADEAIAIARSSGDDATIVRVLSGTHFSLLVPPLLEQSLTRSREALGRAQRLGDPVLVFFAAWERATAVHRAGEIDEMDRAMATAKAAIERLAQPTLDWAYAYDSAMRAQLAGDTDRAEQLASEALRIGTEGGEPDAMNMFAGQIVSVHIQRGTLDELIPLIEQAAAEAPDLAGVYTAVLAFAHAQVEQTEEARRLLEEFATARFDLPMDNTWLTGMLAYAEAAVHCGDPKFARPIFDLLAPWSDQWSTTGSTTAEGPVSRSLGGLATVLERYDEANSYFAHSAALSEQIGARFLTAEIDLEWGSMLVKRRAPGDAERARDLLAKAHSAAVANGYGRVERRARTALHALH